MAIFPKLCSIYRRRGYEIVSGLDMEFSRHHGTEYTWLFENGRPVTNHLGISLKEIYFFECLFDQYHPKRLFSIGNAFGWSSLALALLNPMSQLVVLETGAEAFTERWIGITNDIAQEEGLNIQVIKGRSPDDIELALKAAGIEEIDFAFIDGDHSEHQVVQDLYAINKIAREDGVLLFHDALSWGLYAPLAAAAKEMASKVEVFPCTTSGMAMICYKSLPLGLREATECFAVFESVRALARYFRSKSSLPASGGIEAVLRSTIDFDESIEDTDINW